MRWTYVLTAFLGSGLIGCSEGTESSMLKWVSPEVLILNNQAVKEMNLENSSAAKSLLIEGMSTAPFEPALHYNFALTDEKKADPESAIKSYEETLRQTGDLEVKFRAAFNLGVLHQKAKRTELALKAYQDALSYQPNSREARVNIELLLQDSQGGGGGDSSENKDQNSEGQQDQQQNQGQNQSQNEPKKSDQEGESEDQKGENQKYETPGKQPQPFESQQLSPSDVNKILREIKQQEGKIRSEFNKSGPKEQPRGKEW